MHSDASMISNVLVLLAQGCTRVHTRDTIRQSIKHSLWQWQFHQCGQANLYHSGTNEFPHTHASTLDVRVRAMRNPEAPFQSVRPESTRITSFLFLPSMRNRQRECRECVVHKFELAGSFQCPWPRCCRLRKNSYHTIPYGIRAARPPGRSVYAYVYFFLLFVLVSRVQKVQSNKSPPKKQGAQESLKSATLQE